MRKPSRERGKVVVKCALQAMTLGFLLSAAVCHAQCAPPPVGQFASGNFELVGWNNKTVLTYGSPKGSSEDGSLIEGKTVNLVLSIVSGPGSFQPAGPGPGYGSAVFAYFNEDQGSYVPGAWSPVITFCNINIIDARDVGFSATATGGLSPNGEQLWFCFEGAGWDFMDILIIQNASPPKQPVPPSQSLTLFAALDPKAPVTPSTWFAGKSYPIVIKGTGFVVSDNEAGAGGCPKTSVQVKVASGSSVELTDVEVIDSTTITAKVKPAATDPTEKATIELSGAGEGGCPNGSALPGPQTTAQILGNQIQWSEATTPNHVISVLDDGSGAEPPTQNAVVGKQIYLTSIPNDAALSSLGLIVTSTTWTVDGTRIADYAPTTPSADVTEVTDDDLKKDNITFYWVYPTPQGADPFSVTYQYCVNIPNVGEQCSEKAKAKFNVTGPIGGRMDVLAYNTLNIANLGACVMNGVSFPASVRLIYGSATKGTCAKLTGGLPGITFDPPTGYSNDSDGLYTLVQLINSDVESGDHDESDTDVLDTDYPYGVFPGPLNDSPNALLRPTYRNIKRTMTATSFLMWQPAPPSIPVPLGYQQWTFSGSATCESSCDLYVNWTAHTNKLTGKVGAFKESNSSQTAVDNITLQYGIPTWNGASD